MVISLDGIGSEKFLSDSFFLNARYILGMYLTEFVTRMYSHSSSEFSPSMKKHTSENELE